MVQFLKMWRLLILLFFAFSFIFRTDLSFDQDLGRHIKLGEIILTSHQVPQTNLFSYTYPDFPFINHHYFFEILVFWLQHNFGTDILLLLKISILLMTIALVISSAAKSKSLLLLPLGYLFLHTVRDRVDLRPEILSYLFTALTLFILTQVEEGKRKYLLALPIIQLLWVSTHIYFPVGLILQGIFFLHYLLQKKRIQIKSLGITLGLSLLATFINPNSFEGALYPLRIFGNYGYSIAENQSMFLLESLQFKDPDFLFVKIAVAISFSSLLVGLSRHTLQLKNVLLTILGVGFALVHVRSFPYLFFIAFPAILVNFGTFRKSLVFTAITTSTFLLIIIESYFYFSGNYYRNLDKANNPEAAFVQQAQGALDFVLAHKLPQPIFNNFDIGSYIIYRAYPQYEVFVDGRPEAYPKEFFQQIYIPAQENPKVFQELDNAQNFKTIIFSHTDQTPWAKSFLKFIINDKQWKTVYLDDFIIVLVKNDVALEKKLSSIELNKISAQSYQFKNSISYLRLAMFLINNEHQSPVKNLVQKSLELNPQSPGGNLMMAITLGQTNNLFQLQQAQQYYQKSKSMVWW